MALPHDIDMHNNQQLGYEHCTQMMVMVMVRTVMEGWQELTRVEVK